MIGPCKKCLYYDQKDDKKRMGICRRKPSKTFVIPSEQYAEGYFVITKYPEVSSDDWCGKFKEDKEDIEQ